MPNTENINKLIDAFRSGEAFKEVGFNMRFATPTGLAGGWLNHILRDWSGNSCGTACCIMGHANIMFKGEGRTGSSWAASVLGLTYQLSNELFYCDGAHVTLQDITVPQAIRALEDVRDGKPLDWDAIAAELPSDEGPSQ